MKTTTRRYTTGSPWQLVTAYDALCEDGVIRKIRVRQSPDTWFSHPGRTTILGVPVTGYVTQAGGSLMPKGAKEGDFIFITYTHQDRYHEMRSAILEKLTRGIPDPD